MNERASEESADELSPPEDKGGRLYKRSELPPGRHGNIFPAEPERPNTSDESSLKVEEANKKGQITEDGRVDPQNSKLGNADNEGPGGDSNPNTEEKRAKGKSKVSSIMRCFCFCFCCRHGEK